MKFSKILSALSMGLILVSCSSSDRGVLTGVERRPVPMSQSLMVWLIFLVEVSKWVFRDMTFFSRKTSPEMTSSVTAFYMDETEITNNEYRQFVEWTRDSLIHVALENNGNNAGANQYMKENPITGKMEVNWEDGEVDFREMYLEAKEAEDLATADDTDFGRLKGTVLTVKEKSTSTLFNSPTANLILSMRHMDKRIQIVYKTFTRIQALQFTLIRCVSLEILSTHTTSHLLDDISLILLMTITQSLV